MRVLLAVLMACSALLTACGDELPTAAPSPTPSASDMAVPSTSPSPTNAGQRCRHPTEGYSVSLPAEWFVADGEGIEPCTFFHPEPLDLEPATEADGVAIRLDVLTDPFAEARRKVESDGGQDSQETTVAGRQAVRITGQTTDQGLLPPGLATTVWVVDMGGRSLLLSTDEGGRDDYAVAVEVLDDMARSVEVS